MRLLTDEQWARLAPCLSRNAGKAGRPFADHRRIESAIAAWPPNLIGCLQGELRGSGGGVGAVRDRP